ncbi:bifunctional diguanylate cyclase/phosphodiesterase [Hydrogenivirga sp. 128-5-R1-1]|uniref:bifunctional diguanylate cyclase/phosphodiesterase n=1 Tax=Hydrogenivirga sp. 128-5-R1-1 TaxID=392423 RepID=UPI00015F0C99|nr:bifunctional diguanylate cyclase/phosphodiesterase [Hydrogenivirga sp. 128-5-R1-1]EDP75856.1 diguanylate cyclase/phosphodiesterase (GGDEF & EAL domains) [Hydrogenivirga sp. 128-5-R1-1]
MNRRGGSFNLLALLLAVVIVSMSVPIYMGSSYVETRIQKRVVSDVVSIVGHVFDNIAQDLLLTVGEEDIVIALYHNEGLRREVERKLSLLVTPEIKYVYIVYRDEEGKFRFLVDGSREDKGELGEKLDVYNVDKWIEAIEKKRDVVIVQENLHTIGATYVKPIVWRDATRALLVADFSVQKIREIKGALDLIRNTLSVSLFLVVSFFGVAVYQYFRKRAAERALYVDRLTGLYNKNYIDVEGSRIDLDRYYIALIDIDDFRKINTTYGEEAGDSILREFSNFLREFLGDVLLVRYAGEEFLVLLPKERFRKKSEVMRFFEELKDRVKSVVFPYNGYEVRLKVSIGVNLSPERSRSIEEAIKGADRALYRAKREGKDRVEAHDETVEELKRRLSIADVRDAIESGRVICHYQPIVDLRTHEISHYEALARIKDEKGEIVSPNMFLEDIKGTFIYTRFVKEIIRMNVKLLKEREDIRVSINLIPTDVTDETVLEELRSIDKRIRGRMLLEITEVEGIPSFERMKESVMELRKLGFRICIDDFGAGYSNLINITQMRIDYLKIDGSIIKDIHRNKLSKLLTKTITSFCKEVNIKVIAEYVENEAILKTLRELGVDYGQGFHIGKPKPL